MSANPKLDPYTAKAENDHLTPQEKIDGLKAILKTAGAGMLTTLSKDGHLHSRAMHPSSFEGLHFQFLGNNVSQKFDEIGAHTQVNISFYNHTNTDWASVSGVASISQDKELIKKLWSPFIKGYFTDLGDGVHKGDYNDPRVSVITVVPDEIRYWVCTSGAIGKAVEHAKGAITGHTSAPGEMRTITKQEIQLVEGLNRK